MAPIDNKSLFQTQLEDFSHLDGFSRHLIVDEKSKELSQTHLIGFLWQKFKGALGLTDWTNKDLIKEKTGDFLSSGKNWITSENLTLVQKLAKRAGLITNEGVINTEKNKDLLEQIINGTITPILTSQGTAKTSQKTEENLSEESLLQDKEISNSLPSGPSKTIQIFDQVISSSQQKKKITDDENPMFSSEDESSEDQENPFSSQNKPDTTAPIEQLVEISTPTSFEEFSTPLPPLTTREPSKSSIAITTKEEKLNEEAQDDQISKRESIITEIKLSNPPEQKSNHWNTAKKVALAATAGFAALAAGYYIWQYFKITPEEILEDQQQTNTSNPLVHHVYEAASYFKDKIITYYTRNDTSTSENYNDFTLIPENFYTQQVPDILNINADTNQPLHNLSSSLSESDQAIAERSQTLPIPEESVISYVVGGIALTIAVIGKILCCSQKTEEIEIDGGSSDSIAQSTTEYNEELTPSNGYLWGTENFSGHACYQVAVYSALFPLLSFVRLINQPLQQEENKENCEKIQVAVQKLYNATKQQYEDKKTQKYIIKTLTKNVSELAFRSGIPTGLTAANENSMNDCSEFAGLLLTALNHKLTAQRSNTGYKDGKKTEHSRNLPPDDDYLMQIALPTIENNNKKNNLQSLINSNVSLEIDTKNPWVFDADNKYPEYIQETIYQNPPDLLAVRVKRGNAVNETNRAIEDKQELELPEDGIFDFSTIFGKEQAFKYQLKGAIYRSSESGTGDAGHFVTYNKIKDKWVCYDDGRITIPDNTIAQKMVAQSYLYFFEKIKPAFDHLSDYIQVIYPTDIKTTANSIEQLQEDHFLFHFAVQKNDQTLFDLLLKAGADPFQVDNTGKNCFELLFENDLLLSYNKQLKLTSLFSNITSDNRSNAIKLLHLFGDNIIKNHKEKLPETSIIPINNLIESGLNINVPDSSGQTLLSKALKNGNQSFVEYLKSKDANESNTKQKSTQMDLEKAECRVKKYKKIQDSYEKTSLTERKRKEAKIIRKKMVKLQKKIDNYRTIENTDDYRKVESVEEKSQEGNKLPLSIQYSKGSSDMQEIQKTAVNDHGKTVLKIKREGEDHGISNAYPDVLALDDDIRILNELRSFKEQEKLNLKKDDLKSNNNFYQPIYNVKTAKARLDEVLGNSSNGSYEVTTNPQKNNFQIRFLANSSEGLEKIKRNISYQYALRGQTVPDFSTDSWRNDGNPLILTLRSTETFDIFGFHRTDENAKFDDIMRDLDGSLLSARSFGDLPSFTFVDKDQNGVYKAEYNLKEICQKCGVTYSIIDNIQPRGKFTLQAQFHCKSVLEQKKLKAALALSLEGKGCYNKVEFDMKWRELSLTPDDYVFTLTSNETYTLLGYSNSNPLEGYFATAKRGSAGDSSERDFKIDMTEASYRQNYLLSTSNDGKSEYKRKPVANGTQALTLFQKAAQIANTKQFIVDPNKGVIFDCKSEADAYRLKSLLINGVTNNGYQYFLDRLLEDTKVESTKAGYQVTFPTNAIPRLLGFDDKNQPDLDKCKTIISNIKGTHFLLNQNAQKELELQELVKQVGATSYSIVSYREKSGEYTYSVKFIFNKLDNIQKLKNKTLSKLKSSDGLNQDGFLNTVFEPGGKYSLTLTANQMYYQLGYDKIPGGNSEYDRFAQDLNNKLKAEIMEPETTIHKTEDDKILDQFMVVRNEYYHQRHCGHVTNGAGHSEKVYVGQIKVILAAGPRSFNRMIAEDEILYLMRTKPDYCADVYSQYEEGENAQGEVTQVIEKQPYVRMGLLTENGEFLITSTLLPIETRVRLAIMQDVINFIAGTKEITVGNADEDIYNITRDEFQKGLIEVRKLYKKYKIDYRKILPKD